MKKIGSQPYSVSKITLSPELMEVQGDMPIQELDYENIRDSIKADGVKDPIRGYMGANRVFQVLSGANRLRACRELKISEIPIEEYEKGTWEENVKFAIMENLIRRHFTSDQKRVLAAKLLTLDPELSNRALAKLIGVNDKTVGNVRNNLELDSKIPKLKSRKGADGKTQSAKKSGAEIPHLKKSARAKQISDLKKEISSLKNDISKKQTLLNKKEKALEKLYESAIR
ncbi:ParB N-terminal domain-containing protein [Leptospira andrefontaineae]|uniref:Chromosome partitioning protein ParB n=1 Tax=Leptospira andrefontaineae TaxID=2484976 RepID=A0A4R9H6N9_9LEPT|nr:ParB N-terminal domain-containing protein [Leptospira andrefontaineae]TGK41254.1 chromosome partitioning protein ParB [Leptospira andrefontaineae]